MLSINFSMLEKRSKVSYYNIKEELDNNWENKKKSFGNISIEIGGEIKPK